MSLSRSLLVALASVAAAFVSGCADAPPLDAGSTMGQGEAGAATSADDLEASDEDVAGDGTAIVEKAACGARWALTEEVVSAGDAQSVHYDGPGSRCSGGATQGALALGRYVREQFPDLVDQSIDGHGIQIYNCRNVRGGSGLSVHATGRAVDIFIPTLRGGAADNSKGDVIASWLVENADRIGVQMIIWDRTIWKASGGTPRDRCYAGTHPHNDHVHVELSLPASHMATPFFTEGPDAPVSSEVPPAEAPPAQAPGAPPARGDQYIGDTCTQDADCGFSTNLGSGRCFLEHEPASGVGFCTVDCAGYCPDRDGKAVTFCVSRGLTGSPADSGGVCVSKSGTLNNFCRNPSGFAAANADRFVGSSGARSASADVCLPAD